MAAAFATDPQRLGWRQNRWFVWLVSFVVILAPMSLWALASPLSSVPDEASHTYRAAAVVRGQILSEPWKEHPALTRAEIPTNLANAGVLACFAFDANKSAACQHSVRNLSEKTTVTGGSAGLNSPVYYAIVGLPSLVLDGNAAYYSMRLMNAVLCAFAFAVMFMQLRELGRTRWAMLGAVVGITPMVLYLGGSINPNGVEVAAAGALLATLLAMSRGFSAGRRLWEQAGLALVSASLLMGTRSIALLWVLIIVVVAIMLGTPGRVRTLLGSVQGLTLLAGATIAGALSVLWYVLPPDLAGGAVSNASFLSSLIAGATAFGRSFDYLNGMIGLFGWVDTPAPSVTIAVWVAAIMVLIVASFIRGSRRTRVAVWGLLFICVIVPVVTETAVYAEFGHIWQGRYMLAMLLCLLVIAGLSLDDARVESGRVTVRFISVGLALLAAGHLAAFVTALWRYVVGLGATVDSFLEGGAWEPPLGWKALAMLYAIVLVVGVLIARRAFVTPASPAEESGRGAAPNRSVPAAAPIDPESASSRD
ncbi:DUF2142 domain-containing protein [Plantibacter sp. Mn2098]|uniref:DUF2142 domain-containing protein n=1 Tax=Plantibacter sp. Mn2098 TaxID=3395266 RepID=UPI003BD7FF42